MTLIDALQITSLTDTGQVRSQNEDSVIILPTAGIVILADGMGGHNAGEVASGMATALLAGGLAQSWQAALLAPLDRAAAIALSHDALLTEIANANAAIHAAAQEDPECAGMGTTVVAAIFHDDFVSVAHVGDSRLYRWRGATLDQLTRDHSLLQEQIDGGILSKEEALLSFNKNWLTRAVGVEAAVEVEIHTHEVRTGDLYLVCSDGLYDMLPDERIAALLATPDANLDQCAGQLIRAANEAGGRDNVSVILAKVVGEVAARATVE